MRFKKGWIFICLIICLFLITGVSAGDADMAIQSSGATSDVFSDEADSQQIVQSSYDDDMYGTSFGDLQELINDAEEGSEINLPDDYSLEDGGYTLVISKNLTINGGDDRHSLNGNKLGGLISIDAPDKTVVFKNILFKNGKSSKGGAILNTYSSTSLIFIHCEFDDNYADDYGGAVYSEGSLTFENSGFWDNYAGIDGGAVYCSGQVTINGTDFKKNKVGDPFGYKSSGGAVYSMGNVEVYDSYFEKNHASIFGGAIYSEGDVSIVSSTFENNNNAGSSSSYYLGRRNGGAVYCLGKCTVDSSYFTKNWACDYGGAIYAEGDLTITCSDSSTDETGFIGNSADHRAGAVYTCKNLYINWDSGSYAVKFQDNYEAKDGTSDGGGAVYCEGNAYINRANFSGNNGVLDGGALYCEGQTSVKNSLFSGNGVYHDSQFVRNFGGAICSKGLVTINNCSFEDNYANGVQAYHGIGGAIYAYGELRMMNCSFIGNGAQCGGAVYASTITQEVFNSTFISNRAYSDCGGAIYAYNKCTLAFTSCTFENNSCLHSGAAIYMDSSRSSLKLSNCTFYINHAGVDGGAVYCCGQTTISASTFEKNNATGSTAARSFGGAVRSGGLLTVDKCSFSDNHAYNYGGALYADGELVINECNFTANSAKDAGAIYAGTIGQAFYLKFSANSASSGDGGAIYINNKCSPEFVSCIFEDNSAGNRGGAIYLASSSSQLNLLYDTFTCNSAKVAGAIYSHQITQASNSAFLKNRASDGDGGAVYIFNKCSAEFVSCRFEQNTADNRGGAIYLDSTKSHLKVSYCTFVDNRADKKKYHGTLYHGAGHSVFNSGYYDMIDMCWFGSNSPDFKGQLVEYHAAANDKDHVPSNYLKIAMKINETEVYAGNNYLATVHFYAVNGKSIDSILLHSTGSLTGDAQFSNVQADVNDITGDANFQTGLNVIYGKLDHETVSLSVDVKEKQATDVQILSCDNVTYGEPLEVTYAISGMSDEASYVIRDNQSTIVKEGLLNSPDTLIVEGLVPGSYSITIINPETRSTYRSSSECTFNVFKGSIDLMVVVLDEPYGDDVECIVHSSVDGEYNLTVAGCSTVVLVKNHVGYFNRGILEAGSYTANVSFAGNGLYNPFSNSTSFTVSQNDTHFEAQFTPGTICYGENATLVHSLPCDATGNITYYFSNGTCITRLGVGENLTLQGLDAGHYVIIANYTGDLNYKPAYDTAHLIVEKARTAFEIVFDASEIVYGNNAVATPAALPENAVGTVRYYLENGTYLGEAPANESFVLPLLDAGSYVIVANYSGDGNHLNATANAPLSVTKANSTLQVGNITFEYNSYGSVAVSFINATGIVAEVIGHPHAGIIIRNDTIIVSGLDIGTYTLSVTTLVDANHNSTTKTALITVDKIKTGISANAITATYKVDKYLVITLTDSRGNALSGFKVTVNLNGLKTFTTDKNGQVKVNVAKLVPKTYTVAISFAGDDYYKKSTASVKVIVKKAKPKMVAKAKSFKLKVKTKKYTITLKDNRGKAIKKAKITLKVKGKTYKAKTNSKGKATFKITKLSKKGKYKAVIKYKGNKYFYKVTKKVKIKIK